MDAFGPTRRSYKPVGGHGPKRAAAALGALLLAASPTLLPAAAIAAPMPESFSPLVEQVKNAVVNVSTTELQAGTQAHEMPQLPPGFEEFFRRFGGPGERANRPHKALGSGFIVDPSGFVVTNNHVVENGTDIKVTLADGTTLDAKVVGTDPKTDLAVLKVDAGRPLPAVPFGSSGDAKVGDWVIAVGNPFGLGGTVTAGIVSARGRDIGAGPYDQFLQVDAAINQGNSGGPVFNTQGQVIGVNTAILSPNGGGSVGIGFAIPSDVAKGVVAQLEKSGSVERGFLGVGVQSISPEVEQALGLAGTKGALVADVNADSPAAKAGIRAGDVITAFDGHPIDGVRDLTTTVASTPVGKHVSMDILRDGKKMTVSADVVRLTDNSSEPRSGRNRAPQESAQPRLGMQLAPVTPETRQRYGIPARANGAVVVGIVPGSPAEQTRLEVGDVIQRVNNADVRSPQEVSDAVRDAVKQGRKVVALLVHHKGRDGFITLPLTNS